MSSHADSESQEGHSDFEDAEEAVDRTPRDFQRHGPVRDSELLPRGPPPPEPLRPAPGSTDPPRADSVGLASDSDSQPERRWPLLDGERVSGPPLPDGRFARSSSSSAGELSDSDDEVDEDDSRAGSEGHGSSTWSETSLVLAANCLAHARNMLVQLFRRQLVETHLLSNHELGGRVGGMRRRLADKDWQAVQLVAAQFLEGNFLDQWNDYAFRSTHERRPRDKRPREED